MNKKNLPLIVALSIPLVMIVLVAAFIYLPGLGKKPQYDFLYMTGNSRYYDYGYYQGDYMVSQGKLVKNPAPSSASSTPQRKPDNMVPRFYLYNITADSATEVTFEQAQAYALDSSNTSPDGYTVERGNYGGDMLFFRGGSDYDNWFIKGHNRSKKLNLKLSGSDYYNFEFLGWIVK